MADRAWILRSPLKVLDCEDHPYLESARATLGGRELQVSYSRAREASGGRVEFKFFLDGELAYDLGDASPTAAWFRLCRDQGYDPETHWDWDPALILFQQVIPAMTEEWHEHELPYTGLGVPEGVVCLANLRHVLAERIASWRHRVGDGHGDPAMTKAVELFEWLPLRAVVFHDDPARRVDFVGNALDEPFLGVYLHLGMSRDRAVYLSKATLSSTGGLRWSPWLPGGDWARDGRTFISTQGAHDFLRAASLEGGTPMGFEASFRKLAEDLGETLDPLVEAYRTTYPAGIPWHRDPATRYMNHMIVAVRFDRHPILTLDDGSEITVLEHKEAEQMQDVWGV